MKVLWWWEHPNIMTDGKKSYFFDVAAERIVI